MSRHFIAVGLVVLALVMVPIGVALSDTPDYSVPAIPPTHPRDARQDLVDGEVAGIVAKHIIGAPNDFRADEFYAVGVWYNYIIPDFRPSELRGRITTVSVEASKAGMAGVEQDAIIRTSLGTICVEIISWYYGQSYYKVGVVIFDENGNLAFVKRVPSTLGEIYRYCISFAVDAPVWVTIRDEDNNIVLSESYTCSAQYIEHASSYVEYWRYIVPGSFYYYGYEVIERLYDTNIGWRKAAQCLDKNYNFDHSNGPVWFGHRVWDEYYYDKSEVDDR